MSTPDPHAALTAAREDLADLKDDLATLQALVGDREVAVKKARAQTPSDYANLVNLEANANAARSLLNRHEQEITTLEAHVLTLEVESHRADLEAEITTAGAAYKAARDAHAEAVDALVASITRYAAEADKHKAALMAAAERAHTAATAVAKEQLGPGNHDPQTFSAAYRAALQAGGLEVGSLEHHASTDEIYGHAETVLEPTVAVIRGLAGRLPPRQRGAPWP